MRKLHLAFVFLGILALAACGGIGGGYSPLPSPKPTAAAGSATVTFLVVVPPPTAMRNRPKVTVPSSATSVTFTIDSVNGTAYSGTPITETLSSSNSACTSVTSQLVCDFNVTAPVGALVYTVTVYNGTTVIAEGNVAVTTANGTTVTAPLTLTGTAAKIAITAPSSAIAGIAATYPLTVQVEDANGNTILGTYTSAITLTDSDTSGTTSITTSGSDNPPAGELLSSSDTATIGYNGGTLSTAATIGATASGVSASNVTTATFLPVTNYYAQSGSVSFGVTSYDLEAQDSPSPSPVASPAWSTSTTAPIPIATGQTFDGISTAIGVTGVPSTDLLQYCCQDLSSSATSYYAWTASGGEATFGVLGFNDPDNTYYQYVLDLDELSLQQTCAAPYSQLLVLPMPASWSVYTGSGPCTTSYADNEGDTDVLKYNADGSYTDTYEEPSGYEFPPGNATATVSSSGAATYTLTSSVSPCCGAGTMTIPAPSPGASTIPVSFAAPASGTAFFPSPAPTTAVNPWAAIGLPNGVPPSPLLQDTMTNKGAISALPTMCAVPAGLVPSTNPPLTEVDENIVVADPLDAWFALYTKETVKHYYLNGVGEVCNENQMLEDYFGDTTYGDIEFTSYNGYLGAAINWYMGVDLTYQSYYQDTYTYITQTSLKAVSERVRDFTKVAPTAAMELSETTYAITHAGIGHRPMLRRPKSRFAKH